jgi:hypothetical protein
LVQVQPPTGFNIRFSAHLELRMNSPEQTGLRAVETVEETKTAAESLGRSRRRH